MILSRELIQKSDFPTLEDLPFVEKIQQNEESQTSSFSNSHGNVFHKGDSENGFEVSGSDFRIGYFLEKLWLEEVSGRGHVERYLRQQHRCNLCFETMRNNYRTIIAFLKFYQNKGGDRIEELQGEDIEAFIEHEQDRGLKLTSVKTRLGSVKAFIGFLIERKVLSADMMPWKLTIKLADPLPRAMDPDDVVRLVTVKAGVRNRAMILLLLRTGMRIGELLRTKVDDIIFKEKKILIWESEKNRVGRVVYFTDDAKAALKKWLRTRPKRAGFLFYGKSGGPLTYSAARMVFIKYMAQAGLSHKGYTLHCLRHTYATELINAGMRIEYLQPLLGHSCLEVTRRYARVRDKTREEEYFRAMTIIERREKDGHNRGDRQLQKILEETQLLPPHSQELHEHA